MSASLMPSCAANQSWTSPRPEPNFYLRSPNVRGNTTLARVPEIPSCDGNRKPPELTRRLAAERCHDAIILLPSRNLDGQREAAGKFLLYPWRGSFTLDRVGLQPTGRCHT
jgi:hypothetical protein